MTAKIVIASAERLIDGAPLLAEQEEDGGDQRAGVADTDPEDEVEMSQAQPTGMLMPQTPMPSQNR